MTFCTDRVLRVFFFPTCYWVGYYCFYKVLLSPFDLAVFCFASEISISAFQASHMFYSRSLSHSPLIGMKFQINCFIWERVRDSLSLSLYVKLCSLPNSSYNWSQIKIIDNTLFCKYLICCLVLIYDLHLLLLFVSSIPMFVCICIVQTDVGRFLNLFCWNDSFCFCFS